MTTQSGGNEFPSLQHDLVAGTEHSLKRVLIVTQDILGPVRNGGIGTAYYYLASELARQGHRVSILFSLGRYSADTAFENWLSWYAERDIELIPCPEPAIRPAPSLIGEACSLQYRVYEYLRQRQDAFDMVHASEWGGNLYYCLVAKRLGLGFASIHFVIKASSPLLWNKMGNHQALTSLGELPRIYMERRSIELADSVISGSRYMLGWMRDNGYRLPEGRCFVQPNVFPEITAPANTARETIQVRELAFFGRLEPRKGIAVYIDSLKLLHSKIGDARFRQLKLTFLGKQRDDYKVHRAVSDILGGLSGQITIVDNLGQPEAIEYLRNAPGVLAVMPSLIDNSPFGVYELLAHRVAFVTSNRGGGKELIDPADWSRAVFDADPVAISNCLQRAVEDGCTLVTPSFDFSLSLETWRAWHLQPAPERSRFIPETTGGSAPLVSICMVTCNRPSELTDAVASIRSLAYRPIELIIVDDASDLPAAQRVLGELESSDFDFPFKLIRQSKKYVSAARNLAASEAGGKYLLFMDDDNLARPEELDCLVGAAERGRLDIVTCFSDLFLDTRPDDENSRRQRVLFVGADLGSGLFCNPFGDTNCLVKKSAFQELGGFDEAFKVGKEDQEFFARALLRGYRLEVVPEALYWYRVGKSRIRRRHYSRVAGHQRVASTYISELGLGPDLANGLRYAQSLSTHEIGFMQLLVMKLAHVNALRRFLYRHPRIMRLLRPFLRRLVG